MAGELTSVEEAMRLLAESDVEYAEAVTDLASCKIRQERVRARVFLESEGTVAERNAEAEIHCDTEAADDAYASALLRKEAILAKRQRWDQAFEYWRTLSANQRKAL
jgi:hypothetical protein